MKIIKNSLSHHSMGITYSSIKHCTNKFGSWNGWVQDRSMGVCSIPVCSFCFVLDSGILLLIQSILLNLKPFKSKSVIVACITIAIVIVSVMFYWDVTRIMESYNTIIQDANGVPEIWLAVLDYSKYTLIYIIVSSVLSVANVIISAMGNREIVKNRG